MTEWDLQRDLTMKWADEGVLIDGERHALIAWEVILDSWTLNDPDVGGWGRPSADFLLADGRFNLAVAEVKNELRGVVPLWATLAQVTYSAYMLGKSANSENLARIYRCCWIEGYRKKRHGRDMSERSVALDEIRHHARFFKRTETTSPNFGQAARRVVAAQKFGPSWDLVLMQFREMDGKQFKQRCGEVLTSKDNKPYLERILSIPPEEIDRMDSIRVVTL
jgi:hypothetical protein